MSQGRYPEIEKGLINQRAAELRRQAANERALKAMGSENGGLRRWLAAAARWLSARLTHASQRRAQERTEAERQERQEPRFGG